MPKRCPPENRSLPLTARTVGRHPGGDNFIFVVGHVEYLRDPEGLALRMRGVAGYGNRDLFPFNIDNDADPNG